MSTNQHSRGQHPAPSPGTRARRPAWSFRARINAEAEVPIFWWLREARLRPTVARISALQVMRLAGGDGLTVEQVYRQLHLRGTPTSLATVYRIMHELESAGLLRREPSDARKALYRLPLSDPEAAGLRVICPVTGDAIPLDEPQLHRYLLAAAAQVGIDLRGQPLAIQLAQARRAAPSSPDP
ncbi:MAG: transcriptional repressor [Burkholderiaceae bacterium]|jgi:Fur family ferric uptake transcriptional regulator|nr:transcriptional repressor [Burkholderiaceae bacterium]